MFREILEFSASLFRNLFGGKEAPDGEVPPECGEFGEDEAGDGWTDELPSVVENRTSLTLRLDRSPRRHTPARRAKNHRQVRQA